MNDTVSIGDLGPRPKPLMGLGLSAAWEWHIAEKRLVGDAGFAALYGLSPEDAAKGVAPSLFFSIIHPEDRDRIRLAVGAMLRGAEVFSKEFRLFVAEGATRWVQARGRSYHDENDRPVLFAGVLTDITDQKRIQEQLRIAQTAGGIGTFEYIEGFGTASVSAQFCALLGLHESTDLPIRTINALVQSGDPLLIDSKTAGKIGSALQVELRIKRPDTGEARWLMRRGEYLHDAETAGLRFSGVIYDITNAKSIESQLRTLNETLESRVEERTRERDRIWQVSRDLYVLCKTDGRCSITNPAWQTELGYGPNDAQDRRLTDFVFHDDLSIAHAAIQKVSQGELVQAVDLRMLSKDGTQRRVIWTFVPEGTSFFGAGRDITQRHQLEEQLRQSQKMEAVGQLTGGIAHDFNNLLTGIIGALELVRRRLKQGRFDTLDQLMDAATASAHRAAALTHRLLAFSRRQSLDVRALDVNQLVSSVEDLLQRTLGEQIVLSVKLQSDLWLGLSDANQLENALLNLVINARDAMPNGGELTIATENSTASRKSVRNHPEFAPGDYVMIAVSDTGMGMPPEVLAKAFDPFFTTKPIGKGTGLGLSMIYGFAKQSGGHVEIDSAIGRGTTVKLYMPRFTGVSVSEGHNSKLSTLPRAKGETILVVEDDPSVRMLVLEALKDLDYDIVEATDSQTALPVLQSKRRLDLMISDVGLPGMNGHELAHIAREARADLRILFMTGYTEKAGIRANFLVAGMEMIAKPFTIDALASKIREMLRS